MSRRIHTGITFSTKNYLLN